MHPPGKESSPAGPAFIRPHRTRRRALLRVAAGCLLVAAAASGKDLVVSQEQAVLRAECSDDAAEVARLSQGHAVKLRFSLEGSNSRCYSVSAIVERREVRGFIPKEAVGGAEEFESARRQASASTGFVEVIWGEQPQPGREPSKPKPRASHGPRRGSDLIGQPALDFTLPDLSRRDYRLASLRGKVVLLDFWASWCGPCRRSMPHMEELHREFGRRGLVVLGVNSEPVEKAQAYLRQNGYSFPTLEDKGGAVGREYGVRGIPTSVVIDRSGRVSSYLVGLRPAEQLRAELAKAGL